VGAQQRGLCKFLRGGPSAPYREHAGGQRAAVRQPDAGADEAIIA
jgi:hypothetical protein